MISKVEITQQLMVLDAVGMSREASLIREMAVELMNLRTALGEIHHCHTEGTSTLCDKCEQLAAAGMRGMLPPTYYEGH